MKTIWFASKNKNKINEVHKILKGCEIKSLLDIDFNEDINENALTFEKNALIKSNYIYSIICKPTIGDDSGLCIKKLNNFPGIYSARWANPEKDWYKINEMLLEKMKNKNLNTKRKRKAFFICSISFTDKNIKKVFKSKVKGYITFDQRGENGFAYDKIFQPKGYEITYGQMTNEQKNLISHRTKALEKLKKFLVKKNYL